MTRLTMLSAIPLVDGMPGTDVSCGTGLFPRSAMALASSRLLSVNILPNWLFGTLEVYQRMSCVAGTLRRERVRVQPVRAQVVDDETVKITRHPLGLRGVCVDVVRRDGLPKCVRSNHPRTPLVRLSLAFSP